jgi:uncharacterized membrane protein
MNLGEFEPDVWIPASHPAARRETISLGELARMDVIQRPAVPAVAADNPRVRGHRKPAHRGVIGHLKLRIADRITAFAGSMQFVYVYVALFAIWMLFIESKPWPMLTLIVSLEAIFLSTFVMIGQNRQADFQQAKADHDVTNRNWNTKPTRS